MNPTLKIQKDLSHLISNGFFLSKEIKFLNYSVNLSLFLTTSIVAMLLAMPSSGLEPETSPLPRECSTAELQGQFQSGPGWI